MAGLENGPDDADLKARLEKLSTALDAQRGAGSSRDAERREDEANSRGRGQAMSKGARVLSEFVAGILVGGFIGWELDSWLGTGPWLFVVFLMLGLVAGFWNVYRIAQMSEQPTSGRGASRSNDVPPSGGA